MFEQRIIDQIREAWVRVATGRNNAAVAACVPDARDLKALLELTFVASTKIEEGESVKVRFVFFPDATTESLPQRAGLIDAFAFEHAIPLTVENLRKICPAIDQHTTGLAVGRAGTGYCILGVVLYGRPLSRLDDSGSAHGRPHGLTLSSRSPGSVSIGYSDGVIGRFEDGVFLVAKASALASRALVSHILSVIGAHEQYAAFQMEYWYLYRTCLERLYASAAKIGHGGTIVWMPRNFITSASQRLLGGFPMTARLSGSHLAGSALRAADPRFNTRAGVGMERKDLTDYIDMLAHLSCVDGAVIIDDSLRLLRFACHLACPRWEGEVREGPLLELAPGEIIETSNFGTRHHSAINFAGAHPGVIVFVISEDGPVRTISRLPDEVLIWPDCLNTVFMDN